MSRDRQSPNFHFCPLLCLRVDRAQNTFEGFKHSKREIFGFKVVWGGREFNCGHFGVFVFDVGCLERVKNNILKSFEG